MRKFKEEQKQIMIEKEKASTRERAQEERATGDDEQRAGQVSGSGA